jgi:hypothetical protein
MLLAPLPAVQLMVMVLLVTLANPTPDAWVVGSVARVVKLSSDDDSVVPPGVAA